MEKIKQHGPFWGWTIFLVFVIALLVFARGEESSKNSPKDQRPDMSHDTPRHPALRSLDPASTVFDVAVRELGTVARFRYEDRNGAMVAVLLKKRKGGMFMEVPHVTGTNIIWVSDFEIFEDVPDEGDEHVEFLKDEESPLRARARVHVRKTAK